VASAASTARSSAPVPAAMSDASVASGGAEGVSYGHGLILAGQASGHAFITRPAASWIAELSSSARASATPCSSQDATKVTGPSAGNGLTQKSPVH
jgi:hypothetical protein